MNWNSKYSVAEKLAYNIPLDLSGGCYTKYDTSH